MSYCRWSSMNWMCDVYVYEDCSGGWTTHVAGNRRIIPPIPEIPFRYVTKWGSWCSETKQVIYRTRFHKAASAVCLRAWSLWSRFVHQPSMDLIPSRTIGLDFDGDSFNDSTAGECADTLEMLKGHGYKVPQYAIDALREEQAEATQRYRGTV